MNSTASPFTFRLICLFCLLLSGDLLALGQNATGSITGTITDPNGAVVANATISVTNKANGAQRKLTATDEGAFIADNLNPGEYEVKVEAQGFIPQLQVAVVTVGITTTNNFSLTVGAASQTVEVVGGGAAILNTSDSSPSGVISQKQIESLPLNGRSFLSVAALEPGVTVSYQATSGVLNQNDFF
ncbi:MAG: carboxypeptidase regulatory-like domain-containing protein, partial [Acidobacteria bacterium]|nr:carboxypeptidase regulatory-like domain-containing protein [Acidobacteriota bacterium]